MNILLLLPPVDPSAGRRRHEPHPDRPEMRPSARARTGLVAWISPLCARIVGALGSSEFGVALFL